MLTALVKQDSAAAASAAFDLAGMISTQCVTIASLSAAMPDPSKYAPIALMQDLQGRFSALSTQVNTDRVDAVVKAGLSAGKLLPAQEAWAREYGAKDLAALTAFIDSVPPIALLNGARTGGQAPNDGNRSAALTAGQAAMCAATNIKPEDFAKTLKAERA